MQVNLGNIQHSAPLIFREKNQPHLECLLLSFVSSFRNNSLSNIIIVIQLQYKLKDYFLVHCSIQYIVSCVTGDAMGFSARALLIWVTILVKAVSVTIPISSGFNSSSLKRRTLILWSLWRRRSCNPMHDCEDSMPFHGKVNKKMNTLECTQKVRSLPWIHIQLLDIWIYRSTQHM